jgi:hypothetical protein
MALPFANPISQCMPGFGSPSYYGSASSGTSNTSAVTIIIGNTATTPVTGGTGFNLSGGPVPSSGKWHLRLVGATSTSVLSMNVQVTDGNTLTTVATIPVTSAATGNVDYTGEFKTDVSITQVWFNVGLSTGASTLVPIDAEVSLV